MSKTCVECGAKCCRYFSFEIDEPDDYDEFEDIRWFLMHEGVSVHIDEGDWFISIDNRCKMLGDDNRCQAYEIRPSICRKYDAAECDHTGGDYGYDEHFKTPEQIDAYARKTLGAKVFDLERAKIWDPHSGKIPHLHRKKKDAETPSNDKYIPSEQG